MHAQCIARCRRCTARISLLTPKPPVGFVKSLSFQYSIAVIRKWTRCSTPCAPVKSRSMRISTILQKPTMPESRLKGICQSQLRKINMSTSLILHTRHSCTRAARSLSRSRNSRLAAADGEAKGMGRGKKFQIGDIVVCILCLSLCVAASL